MSAEVAGTTKKNLLSQQDFLAPLPIPTGQKPVDMVNMIWRKNDVYLDIGNFNVAGGVAAIWCMSWLFVSMNLILYDPFMIMAGLIIVGVPTLVFVCNLARPTPLPIRFNRQRREVCVPREDGEYWIVPWETVTAAASQHSSVSQAGKTTSGMLFISFDNPDRLAPEDNKHWMWGFNCGGNEASMSTWECIRSYMEIGPHVLPQSNDFEKSRASLKGRGLLWGTCCAYVEDFWLHLRKGELWEATYLILCIFLFGGPLIFMLQTWKLSPPPTLDYPEIIEWSKPLPSEQWAKRSDALEAAIIQREAELAARPAS
ncbi:DUF6708 domain-containing protein [Pseudomonas saxonica]|uniref:Uncharacterized protein n=1 Tax=Pseudomonas saxonica TaxID=2600598 RepID=A0A5C5Q0C4_9PSED|nr:DUF6708 domain-containing protein [Pseudomonas saxonica]TWR97765.1 hypothetical protein FJD37_06795 [Pseudomonas saxonica]